MSNNIKVGIIGAGIQGVCSALFLQKKGYQVTLFDRDEPSATREAMPLESSWSESSVASPRPSSLR